MLLWNSFQIARANASGNVKLEVSGFFVVDCTFGQHEHVALLADIAPQLHGRGRRQILQFFAGHFEI
jgi:hypothetical protein